MCKGVRWCSEALKSCQRGFDIGAVCKAGAMMPARTLLLAQRRYRGVLEATRPLEAERTPQPPIRDQAVRLMRTFRASAAEGRRKARNPFPQSEERLLEDRGKLARFRLGLFRRRAGRREVVHHPGLLGSVCFRAPAEYSFGGARVVVLSAIAAACRLQ